MSNESGKIEHTQDRYGIRPEAQDFPMMVVMSFVYVCNARCPNCPYTNSNIREDYRDRPLMREDTFKLIADECGPHHAWLRLSGGGEPMLHPQAVELIEYAKAKGCKIGLITNGSRFDETSLARLLACGTDMIEFSVDAGDPVTYERVRPGLDWERLVRTVGLAERGQHLPSQLSGGERQRVAIARAMVTEPAVILADEPTGYLDSRSGAEILELFLALHRAGRTIVIVTHNPEIARVCQRTIHLRDGRVAAAPGAAPE